MSTGTSSSHLTVATKVSSREPMVPAEVDLPSSRAAAVERGAVRYFNGEPCPSGHTAARYTLSGYCVRCQAIATKNGKQAAKARRAST